MVKLVNLTPHPVVIYPESGEEAWAELPPSGVVARLHEDPFRMGLVELERDGDGPRREVPVTFVRLGSVEGLPAPQEDVVFVVSMPLAMALRAKGVVRHDVVYPYDMVRDGDGRILGCRRLARIA